MRHFEKAVAYVRENVDMAEVAQAKVKMGGRRTRCSVSTMPSVTKSMTLWRSMAKNTTCPKGGGSMKQTKKRCF